VQCFGERQARAVALVFVRFLQLGGFGRRSG
jgi:hypothetical protein